MLSRLRQRLASGGPATVVAIIALSVALCGGAFAATASKTKKSGGVVITKLSQISPSVRNQLKGATGPQGSKGDTGAQGAQGAKGDQGAKGNDGASGKSVVVNEIPPETFSCNELGGVEVGVEGQPPEAGIELCNGEDGNPWTAGGTLPPGATETGTYGMQTSDESGEFGIWAPISFQIPSQQTLGTLLRRTSSMGHPKKTPKPPPLKKKNSSNCAQEAMTLPRRCQDTYASLKTNQLPTTTQRLLASR